MTGPERDSRVGGFEETKREDRPQGTRARTPLWRQTGAALALLVASCTSLLRGCGRVLSDLSGFVWCGQRGGPQPTHT